MVVKLLFVGSSLLDISAQCDKSLLEKYGLKSDDCIRATERHDSLFKELFKSKNSRLSAGGSGQNTARIAKWVLSDKGHVTFTGCVGNDEYGIWLKNHLLKEGVNPVYAIHDTVMTGVSACLLSSGDERSMCTKQGAAAQYNAHHLPMIQDILEDADGVFTVGYFLVHSLEVVRKLAKDVKPSQVFAMSLSADYVCKEFAGYFLEIMPYIDVLLGNESEIRTLVKAIPGQNGVTDTLEAARIISNFPRSPRRNPSRIVVISQGSKPVILAEGGQTPKKFEVTKIPNLVDTVGCGDALAGGFLACYVNTRNLDKAVRTGIRAANVIAQRIGCDVPPEPFEEIC